MDNVIILEKRKSKGLYSDILSFLWIYETLIRHTREIFNMSLTEVLFIPGEQTT